jgi:hypothetical protein
MLAIAKPCNSGVANGKMRAYAAKSKRRCFRGYLQSAMIPGRAPVAQWIGITHHCLIGLPRRRIPLCHNAATQSLFGAICGRGPITTLIPLGQDWQLRNIRLWPNFTRPLPVLTVACRQRDSCGV